MGQQYVAYKWRMHKKGLLFVAKNQSFRLGVSCPDGYR